MRRVVAGMCWAAAMIVLFLATSRMEAAIEVRLAERVAAGVPVEATVTEVEVLLSGRILGRVGATTRRLTVEYVLDGSDFRSELRWLRDRPKLNYQPGDTVEIYVDEDAPTSIATETGGGSDGWILAAPRNAASALGVLATLIWVYAMSGKGKGRANARRRFPVVLRGYDTAQVDDALKPVLTAHAAGDTGELGSACDALSDIGFRVVLRGYDRSRVDQYVKELCQGTIAAERISGGPGFTVGIRGYLRTEVDAILSLVESAVGSNDPDAREAALEKLAGADFPVALRGYDRQQVDAWVVHATAVLGSRQGPSDD